MADSILGARIRERRRRNGLTQSHLAKEIGISASYLNLIESNKRRITPDMLQRIANALDAGLEELDGASERRLAEVLTEVAHLPALEAIGVETGSAGEMIGRYPGWARALAALARSEREANSTARLLADRLAHDPFLAETVHRMLSRVSALRSAVEIVTDFDDIEPEQNARFMAIIRDETESLSEIGESLTTYFEKTETSETKLTPVDEVEALFERNANRFERLETLADGCAPLVGQRAPLPPMIAAHSVTEEHLSKQIKHLATSDSSIETTVGRTRAIKHLTDYTIHALLLPMQRFLHECHETRFDIEALAVRCLLGVEVICQRLSALPEHDPEHPDTKLPRIGYFQANASGTILQMLGLPGLALPRYASACPLWVLYRAQQVPETVLRQRVVFPNGARFVFAARARRIGDAAFDRPRHYVTDMIAMTEEDAARTVYAPNEATFLEEVGPTCRLCPRHTCAHRVEDPLVG